MKVITFRIEDKELEDLKKIESEEKRDRAEVVRRLLSLAVKQWKISKALELLKEHKVTIRKAAKLADLTYSEMFDLMAKSDIDIGYSLKDLQKDVQ